MARQGPMMRRVLVVGHSTSHEVLTAARDLGAAGWQVQVATGAQRSLAGASRFVTGEHRVCAPDVDLESFIQGVSAAVRRCGAQVVVGCGDPELLALSWGREQVAARVPLAEHSRVRAAVDKLLLTRAAAEVGLLVPRTEVADDRTLEQWRGPAVVKPRLHFDPDLPPATSWTPTRLTRSPRELARAVQDVRAAGRRPVIQEIVRGDLIALSAVRTESGRLTALMQQRATRTWPPRTGVSARAVTVPVDPALGHGVTDLLDHLGWVGIVQLQFLQPDSGPPRLLDLNGRPYGSLPLAGAAGLPLLAHWLEPSGVVARGRPSPATARPGATYSRGVADLKRALTERQGGVLRDVASTCRAWWGAAHPVADRHDLRPLLLVPVCSAEQAVRNLFRISAAERIKARLRKH